MCLVAFAWRAHPRYELVFAANRDEAHHRPSQAAGFWADAEFLLAGRDLTKGGTWCGVTRSGRFAAVTNYRDPSRAEEGKASRGELVRGFLTGREQASASAERFENSKAGYSEFNLLLGDPDGLWYVGSRATGPRAVEPGVHGVSNGAFDLSWPKVRHATSGIRELLSSDDLSPAPLLDLLASRRIAADEELPDTGVGLQVERFLSAPFIVNESYGTRASTVILIERDGAVRFVERRFDPKGHPTGETDESFQLKGRRR